jgi:hypothetical protein
MVQHLRRGQRAQRWAVLVEIDLRIAFVGGDDEVVLFRQVEQLLPLVERQDLARGVARGADIDHLHGFPQILGNAIKVHGEAVLGQGVEVEGLGAREQRGALVDLVEGVGRDDPLDVLGLVDDRLGEGKQGFPATVHREDLSRRIERHAITAATPSGDAAAQRFAALGRGIARQAREVLHKRLADEVRCRVFRLADGEIDMSQFRRWGDAGEEFPQFLERVGV